MKKKRAPPPPSPTPDYLQEDTKSPKPKEKDLLSKSVSSLVTDKKSEDKVRLEKKISGMNVLSVVPVVEVAAICSYQDPVWSSEAVRLLLFQTMKLILCALNQNYLTEMFGEMLTDTGPYSATASLWPSS